MDFVNLYAVNKDGSHKSPVVNVLLSGMIIFSIICIFEHTVIWGGEGGGVISELFYSF